MVRHSRIAVAAAGAAVAVVCGSAILPSDAAASRVSASGEKVVYRADRGEANRVVVTPVGGGGNGPVRLSFRDSGARQVRTGRGCSQRGGHRVECAVADITQQITELHLGDRSDRTFRKSATARTVQFGGPGNDVLRGGGGRDRLFGGPGRDRLKGFEGKDGYAGGDGRDRIDSVDFNRERVNCGRGRDRLWADSSDRIARCDRRTIETRYSERRTDPTEFGIWLLRKSPTRAKILIFSRCEGHSSLLPFVQIDTAVDEDGSFSHRRTSDIGTDEVEGRFTPGRAEGSFRVTQRPDSSIPLQCRTFPDPVSFSAELVR